MKYFTVLALCASFCAITLARPAPQYTTKYDDVNLQEILHSDRLLTNYYKCLTDQGNCPPDGAELKRILPDALQNKCAACSEKQKEGAKMVANYIIKNKPDWYKTIEKLYDPTGAYRKKYADEARAQGINV